MRYTLFVNMVGGAGPAVDRVEVVLPRSATVLVFSDLHLSTNDTDASALVTAEVCERLAAVDGPAAVVLNGDCFELLAVAEPSMAAILDAHAPFVAGLRAFAVGHPDRHIVVLAGNHDGRLAWDPATVVAVQDRLPATVALAADLVLDTPTGKKVVRVEHGHRFDPANAFADPRDPHDTPLGHHVVQEVLPELANRPFLSDAVWLADASEFPQFLASRVVYRQLARHSWWLIAPFVVAFAVRTPVVVRALSSVDVLSDASRWFVAIAAGIVADALAIVAAGVLVARRVFSSLSASRLGAHGTHRNEAARAAAAALCRDGFAGFVTGHTHRPELRSLHEGFYANSGCGVRVVSRRASRIGLPPVFASVARRSWIEISTNRDLDVRLIVAETPTGERTMLERAVERRRSPVPSMPTVVAALPGASAWPIESAALDLKAARTRIRRLAAGFVAAVAALGVLSSVTPPLRGRLHGLLRAVPVQVPQAASVSLVFASLALLLLARGLRRGSRIAWVAALTLTSVSAMLHVVKGGDVEEAAVAVALALWLARHPTAFPVRPDAATWKLAVRVGAGGVAAALGASFLLVAALGARRHATRESLREFAGRLAGRHLAPVPAVTPFVWPALTAAAVAIALAVAWVVLSPRRPHQPSAAERQADRRRAAAVVRDHGGDTLAYFALRDDKQWFFAGSSVVAHAVRNGVCLVSPDPIGPETERAEVWAEFAAFADRNGWTVSIVGAQPGWLPIYEAAGMQPIYMGDEAIVDCSTFTLDGGGMKSLRGAYNRVKKAGFTVVFADPSDVDPGMRAELVELMGDTRRGETERGFSMTLSRIFDPDDKGLLLSIALDPDGKPAAFCQWVPARDIDGWSLDLMRRRADPDLPNGVTDFVVIETINHAKATHCWGLCLNFAVLRAVVAGEREGRFFALQRKVLHRFSDTMQIESLWRYNEKFRPFWRPRYVVVDAVENVAAQGIAIADAEEIWELPVIGRFVGRRQPSGDEDAATVA